MDYRTLGNTGIRLSRIGLGGHEFLADGRSRGFNEDFERATEPGYLFSGFGAEARRQVLKLAYEHGINFYDVTQDSEKEALGRNLREMPPPFEVYVQTRPECMMYDRDPGNRRMADYGELKPEVERILRLMQRGHLDFLNLGITPEAYERDPEYLERLRDTTQRLKQEGLIRFTTADTFRGEEPYLRMIDSGAFDTVFMNLNAADAAGLQRVLPHAASTGLGVIGREAFMKGELFRMGEEAGLRDKPRLARAALKWCLSLPELACMVVGMDRSEHFRANMAALDEPALTDDETVLLERLKDSPTYRAYEAQRRREFLEGAAPARI